MTKPFMVHDTELIGTHKPTMIVCCREVGKTDGLTFDMAKKKDRQALFDLFDANEYTFVGFNSRNFDQPLISMALWGHDLETIKLFAGRIIEDRMMPWDVYREARIEAIDYDHIDLIDVAPGVMTSLKTYAGRLGYPTLIDLPFEHTRDLTPAEKKVLRHYCMNDLGSTEALLLSQMSQVQQRIEMSAEYGIDLRSKSDAQIAEAILKKNVGIGKNDKTVPLYVTYEAPTFIQSDSEVINSIVRELEACKFTINRANGSVNVPDFLAEPIKLGSGTYQMGVGGLHSTHDQSVSYTSTDTIMISDIDVASYYPNIMMKAGLIPRLGGKGEAFLSEYKRIYDQRMAAKRAGNKKLANSLKITLNGTFGKLGNIYCSFYSPDLMLAVTITGQLNLLCLIWELEKIPGVQVISANTDGLMIRYPKSKYNTVFKTVAKNAKRTGFEYEETPYSRVALKDVNNYLAVTEERSWVIVDPKGKIVDQKIKPVSVKSKGLYASNDPAENELYLMKNPTMEVCSKLARLYLKDGTLPEDAISRFTDIKDFVAIRNVKGGGVQHTKTELVDDWVCVQDNGDKTNLWMRQKWLDEGRDAWDQGGGGAVMRKSRPAPVTEFSGGKPFGRVARWYMTTKTLPPITYVGSGNKVPKTDGAMLCMTLPDKLPKDLNLQWYIDETYEMLMDMGVKFDRNSK